MWSASLSAAKAGRNSTGSASTMDTAYHTARRDSEESFVSASEFLQEEPEDSSGGRNAMGDAVDTSTEPQPHPNISCMVEGTTVDGAGIDDAINNERTDNTSRIGTDGGHKTKRSRPLDKDGETGGKRIKTTACATTSVATAATSATTLSTTTSVTTGFHDKDNDDRTTAIGIKPNTNTLLVPMYAVPVTTNTANTLRMDDDIIAPTKRPKQASVSAGFDGLADGKTESSTVRQPSSSSSSARSIITVMASINSNCAADRGLNESHSRYVTTPTPKKRKATTSPSKKAALSSLNKKFKTTATQTQGEDGKKKIKPTTQTTATITAAVATTSKKNLSNVLDLLPNIASYLPNEDRMKLALVSSEMSAKIPRATKYKDPTPGTITPVLYMSPSTHTDGERGRFGQLVNQLQQHVTNTRNVRYQYQHASMMDYHEFRINMDGGQLSPDNYMALENEFKANTPRIEGITSLDFCFSSTPGKMMTVDAAYVLRALSSLFTSLREVDLTNTGSGTVLVTKAFCKNCPRLENLTVNSKIFTFDGSEMKYANNLKELHMDGSWDLISKSQFDAMADLSTDNEVVSKQFLLHLCGSKVLERVSIHNAKFGVQIRLVDRPKYRFVAIPQNALMKFIRNAPSTLRWFRSNLTPKNIKLVQQDRPDIEFVS